MTADFLNWETITSVANTKKPSSTSTKVTRIKASDAKASTKKSPADKKAAPTVVAAPAKNKTKSERVNIFVALGRYFKGAWIELKQVRWPTRKATWELTAAVLLFTLFFVVLVVILDAGFKALFERIFG